MDRPSRSADGAEPNTETMSPSPSRSAPADPSPSTDTNIRTNASAADTGEGDLGVIDLTSDDTSATFRTEVPESSTNSEEEVTFVRENEEVERNRQRERERERDRDQIRDDLLGGNELMEVIANAGALRGMIRNRAPGFFGAGIHIDQGRPYARVAAENNNIRFHEGGAAIVGPTLGFLNPPTVGNAGDGQSGRGRRVRAFGGTAFRSPGYFERQVADYMRQLDDIEGPKEMLAEQQKVINGMPKRFSWKLTHRTNKPRKGFTLDMPDPDAVEAESIDLVGGGGGGTGAGKGRGRGKGKGKAPARETGKDEDDKQQEDDGTAVVEEDKKKPAPSVVCAGCQSRLVIGAPTPEQRIYALPCGHLLDGWCVRTLTNPRSGEDTSKGGGGGDRDDEDVISSGKRRRNKRDGLSSSVLSPPPGKRAKAGSSSKGKDEEAEDSDPTDIEEADDARGGGSESGDGSGKTRDIDQSSATAEDQQERTEEEEKNVEEETMEEDEEGEGLAKAEAEEAALPIPGPLAFECPIEWCGWRCVPGSKKKSKSLIVLRV